MQKLYCSRFVGAIVGAGLLGALPASAEPFQGGFGGPEWRIAEVGRANSWLIGGKGAGFVSETLYLGGAGYTLVQGPKRGDDRLGFGYGGFLVGHQQPVGPDQVLDLELLIGAGAVGWRSGAWPLLDAPKQVEPLSVLELSAGLHWNWLSWLSLGVGGSYRMTGFIDTADRRQYPDLDGIDLRLELRFGG